MKTTKLFSNACFRGDGKLLNPGKTIDVTFKLSRGDINTNGDSNGNDKKDLILDGEEDKSEEYKSISRTLCAPTSRKMCVSLQWKTHSAGVGDGAFNGSSRCFATDIWKNSNDSPAEMDEDENAVATNFEFYSQTGVSAAAKISDAKTFPNGVVSLPSPQKTKIVPVTITCFNGSRERVDVTFDATDMNEDEENNSARNAWTTATDIASSLTRLDINKEQEDSNNNSTSQQQQHLKKVLLREKGTLSPFVWIRETRKTIRRVPPGASVTFDASLLVFKPGAFRVDNFKVHFVPSSSKVDDDIEDDIEDDSIEDNKTHARRLAPCAGFSLFVVG